MRTASQPCGLLALALALVSGQAAGASITGVCPDGSIFVVQRAESIPCAEAKQVAPQDVPPIKPEYLPRPYGWEVFQRRQDPNNPYNVIDSLQVPSQAGTTPPAPDTRAAPRVGAAGSPPSTPTPLPGVSAAVPGPTRNPLELADDEVRDLALIVEVAQQRAPARLERGAGGAATLVLRIARSTAFEARLRAAWEARGEPIEGAVVVFTAEAIAPGTFHANLTFAQRHAAFHPNRDDPRQFGLVKGRSGPLSAGEIALGYVVLPPGMDPRESMDVYWDDQRVTTTLSPAG